ncbi:hypothetical protein F-S17_0028 [Faustovirus]|nr:hypothetical protein F-LCD7_0043 [Faustovirus]QJX71806.1 hypothetical protein F-M6_0043 [Faustovirus]QJX72294.1 hypothetical protein F-S17_0028 [Faustovirus]QJX72804.1 hypothetical protein F-VV57_0042 [Faustovirus]QJX73309.1 hypothetical protein F-VV63_0043 [Faustovirus]
MSQSFLDLSGKSAPVAKTDYSTITCDKLQVQVFERLITKSNHIGYIDESAEIILAGRKYATTSPFWIISGGIANLVRFNDVYIGDGIAMARDINKVLNRVVPLWQYSKRSIISNGTFYEFKWVFNKTAGILMVELTNGVVQYYRTTLTELYESTEFDRYEDGRHDVTNPDFAMSPGDELYIYRDHGVLVLVFEVIRSHVPMRPLEYVNAAFCPRPASICVFSEDSVAATMAKK